MTVDKNHPAVKEYKAKLQAYRLGQISHAEFMDAKTISAQLKPAAEPPCDHCGTYERLRQLDRFGNWLCRRCTELVAADEYDN